MDPELPSKLSAPAPPKKGQLRPAPASQHWVGHSCTPCYKECVLRTAVLIVAREQTETSLALSISKMVQPMDELLGPGFKTWRVRKALTSSEKNMWREFAP